MRCAAPGTQGSTPVVAHACAPSTSTCTRLQGIGMSVWQNSCDGQDVVDAAESAEAARRGHPPSSGTPQHPPRTSNWYNFARKHKFFGQAKEFAAAWKTSNDFWNQCVLHNSALGPCMQLHSRAPPSAALEASRL